MTATFDATEVASRLTCPPWCTLEPGHDLGELPGGRIHYAPIPHNLHVSMNDDPNLTGLDRRWYAEVIELEIHEDTPLQLAAELRRAAADIVAAAEWLETHQ